MLTFIFAVEPIFFSLSLLQYWSFLWLLHFKKKTFVVDLSRTLWSKKLLLWLDGWTNHLTVFTFLENTMRFSSYLPSSRIKAVCWNVIGGVWQVRKKTTLFLNNLTNLWSSCGNLFFFSVSSTCTSVVSHSPLQRLSDGVRGCVVRI